MRAATKGISLRVRCIQQLIARFARQANDHDATLVFHVIFPRARALSTRMKWCKSKQPKQTHPLDEEPVLTRSAPASQA